MLASIPLFACLVAACIHSIPDLHLLASYCCYSIFSFSPLLLLSLLLSFHLLLWLALYLLNSCFLFTLYLMLCLLGMDKFLIRRNAAVAVLSPVPAPKRARDDYTTPAAPAAKRQITEVAPYNDIENVKANLFPPAAPTHNSTPTYFSPLHRPPPSRFRPRAPSSTGLLPNPRFPPHHWVYTNRRVENAVSKSLTAIL
jgi:hypothetical protein